MGIRKYKAIQPRQKSGVEIPCPICGTKVRPKCPFYAVCVYRLGNLGIPQICISHPEMCDFFKQQGGASKIKIEINPSRRDEQEYESI